jgi:hypothetical protein
MSHFMTSMRVWVDLCLRSTDLTLAIVPSRRMMGAETPPHACAHTPSVILRDAAAGKSQFKPHRLDPAQFNEFYRQCSRRPFS